jgi:NAD(P)-dependent dehydrogenase (short-subunit alcohol dehydrogenase family)
MTFHHANVAKEEDWKSLMAMAHEKYGHVDILVNNAGTSYRTKAGFSSFRDNPGLFLQSPLYKSPKMTSIVSSM